MLRQQVDRLAPFALALILAVGLAVPYLIAAIWVIEIYESWGRGKQPWWSERLIVTSVGVPLIKAPHEGSIAFRMLNGTAASDALDPPEIQGAWLRAQLQAERRDDASSANAGWAKRVIGFSFDASSSNYWYFVVTSTGSNRRGYFVGFNKRSWMRAGFIGLDGFHSDPLSADREFPLAHPVSLYREPPIVATMLQTDGYTPIKGLSGGQHWIGFARSLVYVNAIDRLLKVDLNEQTVKDALGTDDVTNLGRVVRQTTSGGWLRTGREALLYAARSPDRVTVLDTSDQSYHEFRIPAELRHDDFVFYPLHDNTAIFDVSRGELRPNRDARELTWATLEGSVLRTKAVELEFARNWEKWASQEFLQAVIALPAPLVTSALPCILDSSGGSASLLDRYRVSLPAIGLSILIAVVAILLAANLHRKYRVPSSLPWLAFVFLLGLPGYIGYRLHRRWPIREQAPPAPVLTGVEIFA